MNILLFMAEILSTFIEGYIFFEVMELLSNKNNFKKIYLCKIFVTAVYVVIVLLLNRISAYSFITVMVSALVLGFLSKYLVNVNIKTRMWASLGYILFIGILDMFCISCMSLVIGDVDYFLKIISESDISRIWCLIIVKSTLICIFLFSKNTIKEISMEFINDKLFMFSTIIYILIQNYIAEILILSDIKSMKIGLCMSWIIFIVIMAVVIMQSFKINKLMMEKERQSFYSSKNESLENHIKKVNELYVENSKKVHEFNHHLTALKILGDSGDYSEMRKYLSQINETEKYVKIIFTGTEILDIVLNVKKEEALAKNIEFIVDAEYPSDSTIKESDVCSLLSNLIDNAIDACEKVIKNRKIKIVIKYNNNAIIYKITNSIAENPADNNFKSKKGIGHGWGNKIIADIVERYNGSMNYTIEKNKIITKMIMYY